MGPASPAGDGELKHKQHSSPRVHVHTLWLMVQLGIVYVAALPRTGAAQSACSVVAAVVAMHVSHVHGRLVHTALCVLEVLHSRF